MRAISLTQFWKVPKGSSYQDDQGGYMTTLKELKQLEKDEKLHQGKNSIVTKIKLYQSH